MKSICVLTLIVTFVFAVFAQTENQPIEFNLGFEKVTANEKLPDKWLQFGSGYNLKIDTTEKKSGNNSVLIEAIASAEKSENALGAIACQIPADYQGKEIELRGFLKLKDVSDGFAGLWMRIDGDGGVLEFDNMQSRQIQGTSDWTQYTIKLPLPEAGTKIIIGALLTGKGQIWADDFQLLIDGKDISEAKTRPMVEYKAKKDKEFDGGSKITTVKLNDSKTKDLAVLGRVWGFLKYYHPAIAKGDYNWDYELFRILPKILESKNPADRNAVLSACVESLGTFETGTSEKIAAEKIKLNPDLSWIESKTLGDKLTNQLNQVKNAKRENKNYYIGLFPNIGNPQFKNEEAYKLMSFPDAGFRLLSLYRYWNIIQYYFPNRHLIGENWNDVLEEFIPKFTNAASEIEYKIAALALINRIHDTHANIWGKDETLEKYRGLNSPAIGVTFIEDKAVVTKFWDQTLAEKSGLKIGDVIETINNRKVSEIVKERLDLTPASNYPTKLRDIARYLLQTNENSLTIKYKRGNTAKEIQLECYPKDKLKVNFAEQFNKPIPPFKLISNDIAYLYPGSLKQGEIAKIIPEIAKTKGLIIDLRSYPSDFIVFSLGEFLVPKATSFVKFSNGNIANPGLFTLTDEIKIGKDNGDYYKGKVVILINETTQSQAEYTTMAFRTAPRATVIGSTTAGADGNVSQFSLPGGISTMISGLGVYYPDGKETQRVGIVPDIVIKSTIKGIAEGKDEVLEKAVEIINAK
jgi:C-terminal processing protease CtpA/Prc